MYCEEANKELDADRERSQEEAKAKK